MKKVHTMIFIFLTTLFIISIMFIGVQIVGTNNDWIGFLGGVIGSSIGVFGVYWTMKENQKRREEERKEDFFYQNSEVYSAVVEALKENNHYKVSNSLKKIKISKNWIKLDINTKVSIEKIILNCKESDEESGLEGAIYSYLLVSCGDILSEEKKEFDESTGFSWEVLVPSYHNLQSLSVNIRDKFKEEIDYDIKPRDFFESKAQFKFYINKFIDLPLTDKQYDELYHHVLKITKSEQWAKYFLNRKITTNLITDLHQNITGKSKKIYQ